MNNKNCKVCAVAMLLVCIVVLFILFLIVEFNKVVSYYTCGMINAVVSIIWVGVSIVLTKQ